MLYTKPYPCLSALMESDLSNKHLDTLESLKHFKGITEDVSRQSLPEQIILEDQRLQLRMKRSFSKYYGL